MKTVLFWDIDGTLLTTARAGIFAWEAAGTELLGTTVDLQGMITAGLTDVEIARLIVATFAPQHNGDMAFRVLKSYERYLPDHLPSRTGKVFTNVRFILGALSGCPDVLSLLLTGNTRAGAGVKLRYYGLSSFLEDGAFADDGEKRPTIAAQARRRAEELLGEPLNLESTYVIGDTPHDIACGKSIGARTIAVATGMYSCEELGKYQPWWSVSSLPPAEEFLHKLGIHC